MTARRESIPARSRPVPQAQGIKRYYTTLREHVVLIVACVVITVGAAAAYVFTASKKYSAQAQMLVSAIPAANSSLVGLPVLHSSNDPTRDVLTAASLITTTQVANAVVNALHLKETPSALLASVQATPIGQSSILAIQAQAPSAGQAQALANQFAKQVLVTRTATLHAVIATQLPGLRAEVAKLPLAQRSGPGTVGDQLSQVEQLQNTNDPTITIASPADLPSGPSSPRTSLALAAGLFGGLILGIGAAFAFDALDPSLRREEQLREVFNVPILARIPREQTRNKRWPMIPRELSFGGIEGYRTLRTLLTSRAGDGPKAFLLTGSAPSEGKTTSAINLAVALAQGGARVILIEADLRRPTIAATLGLKVTYGTEHVLTGEVELPEALVEADVEGVRLRVLALRRVGVDVAARLSYAVAQRLIKDAKELADFVVIDSPPLTAVIDALPLAQSADQVLVVARVGTSKISKLSELNDLLLNAGSPATGLVLVGESPRLRPAYDYYSSSDHEEPRTDTQNGRERGVDTVRTLRE